MDKIKRKLIYLTALTTLFNLSELTSVKGETVDLKSDKEITNKIEIDDFKLEPLEFGYIFGDEEELAKNVNSSEAYLQCVLCKGLPYYIPAIENQKIVIFDDNIEINEEKEILFSTISKRIGKEVGLKLKKEMERLNYNWVFENTDIFCEKAFEYSLFDEEYINLEYINEIFPDGDINEISFGHRIDIDSVIYKEYMNDYWQLCRKRVTTLNDFLEFYKKAIPEMYWPLRLNLDNAPINSDLPKLNKEMSNLKFSTTKGRLYFITSEDYEDVKIVILNSKRDGDIFKKYDTFTGELIRTDKYTNSGKKVSYNEEYYKSIGIKDNKDERDQFYSGTGNTIYDDVFLKHPILKHFLLLFADCKNVGDMVEVYKYLPEEYIPEHYKTFDFTQSPNVVQPLIYDNVYLKPSSNIVIESDTFITDMDNLIIRPKMKS